MAQVRPQLRIALIVAVAVTLVTGVARASAPVTTEFGEGEAIGTQAPIPTVAPAPVDRGTPQILPATHCPGSSVVKATFADARDAAPAPRRPAPPCGSARRRLLCTYRL